MKLYIVCLFGGKDLSVGRHYADVSERKRFAQHWWEIECWKGERGDRGWLMDVHPDGTVRLKEIKDCYVDNVWESKK